MLADMFSKAMDRQADAVFGGLDPEGFREAFCRFAQSIVDTHCGGSRVEMVDEKANPNRGGSACNAPIQRNLSGDGRKGRHHGGKGLAGVQTQESRGAGGYRGKRQQNKKASLVGRSDGPAAREADCVVDEEGNWKVVDTAGTGEAA